jgi:hypothetical protein
MRKTIPLIFCLLLITVSSTLGQDFICPIPVSQVITTPRVCPDPLKEQRNRYLWEDNLDYEGLSYGRGKCAGGLECWPVFHQPTKIVAGSQGIYDLYYVQHKVDERTVVIPSSGSPSCTVLITLTFDFPITGPGKCFKPLGTCLAAADWITFPSTGCITGLFFMGPCTRSNAFRSRCDEYIEDDCSCSGTAYESPIVIDVDHSGFALTSAANGVAFNFLNDGVPLAMAWTSTGSTNAFLVLDRNGNGAIDSGQELFGDITPQPQTASPNGFLALAEYDKTANGYSEPNELHTLAQLALSAIDLNYKESKSTDAFGNKFRYRAKVYDSQGVQAGRWAWDVLLTIQ